MTMKRWETNANEDDDANEDDERRNE